MPAVMERTVSVDRTLARRAERKLDADLTFGNVEDAISCLHKRPASHCSCRKARLPKARRELDPSFYGDLESFRNAVADGTVDVAKGCRDMDEYHLSLERRHV